VESGTGQKGKPAKNQTQKGFHGLSLFCQGGKETQLKSLGLELALPSCPEQHKGTLICSGINHNIFKALNLVNIILVVKYMWIKID
jgi:hypothetical protein